MKNTKFILPIVLALFLFSLIGTGVFYSSNCKLSNDLSNQNLTIQDMINEKANLDKELHSYKENVGELKGTNQNLQNMLDASKIAADKNLMEVQKLKKENGEVKSLRQQLADMKQMKINAENMASADKSRMQSEINSLNSAIASLTKDNKEMADNMELLRAVTVDNFHTEATKRKERLTVTASRTRQIKTSFDMPQGIDTDIKFNITKPDGTKISGADKGIAFVVTENKNASYTASAGEATGLKLTKKVEMTYQPKEKLKKGDYIIEMTNKSMHVAYCHVKLR